MSDDNRNTPDPVAQLAALGRSLRERTAQASAAESPGDATADDLAFYERVQAMKANNRFAASAMLTDRAAALAYARAAHAKRNPKTPPEAA